MLTNMTPALQTDLDPLIISSPTIRSGTTLVQRLLCSSSSCLIFGESVVLDLEMLLGVYAAKAMMYSSNRRRLADITRRVVEEGLDGWMPELMPDVDEYTAAIGRGC